MLVQEDHNLADSFLIRPTRGYLGRAHRTNASDIAQPLWRCFDDIEDVLVKGFHQTLGINWSDTADHARAEVFLDPVQGRRR